MAYSYIRFSTPEQLKGDSKRRQLELAQEYVEKNTELNLSLDNTLNLNDMGISAYKGKNIEQGGLGIFIKAVEEGKVKRGSYLLVESLDRLSRQNVETAYRLLLSLLDLGIVVVTLMDNKKYETGHMEMIDMITSVLIMERAHEESKTKGERISKAWRNKKNNIDNIKLTKWSPKWLNLSKDRKTFEIINDRVQVVEQIFKWTVEGLGTKLIIQRLENNGIKPWDMGIIKREKRLAKQWYAGIIQRILTDRTVLGEYILKNKNGDDKIIPNYYPRIIDDDLYYLALASRKSRRVSGGGRKGKNLSNLFSKLAYCGYSLKNNKGGHKCDGDNQIMVYANKGAELKNKYLQCARLMNGNTGCTECRKMWRYDNFETSFLTHISDIDVSVLLGTPNRMKQEIELLQEKVNISKGKLSHLQEQIKGFGDSMEKITTIPKLLLKKMVEIEEKEKITINEIQELKSELKKKEQEFNSSDQVLEELSSLITVMEKTDNDVKLFDIRLRLSNILKTSIDKIEVYSKGKIYDDAYYDKIRKKLGKEAEKIIKENEKQKGNKAFPFYIVKYKSGEQRIIFVNPKDPLDLHLSMKLDNNGLLEKQKLFSKHLDL